jgi:hypothetical protein
LNFLVFSSYRNHQGKGAGGEGQKEKARKNGEKISIYLNGCAFGVIVRKFLSDKSHQNQFSRRTTNNTSHSQFISLFKLKVNAGIFHCHLPNLLNIFKTKRERLGNKWAK